jgi:hypothetical protein
VAFTAYSQFKHRFFPCLLYLCIDSLQAYSIDAKILSTYSPFTRKEVGIRREQFSHSIVS